MNEHLHLKWDGPTAFGFDERERMEFAKIHRQVRNTLSRRKKNNSLRSLQQQQISIENMLNNAKVYLPSGKDAEGNMSVLGILNLDKEPAK